MNDPRYSMNWRPAYGPRAGRAALAQTQMVVQAPEPAVDVFLGSPGVALATDVAAAGMSSYVAYHLGRINSGWATFWWVVATASVMKGLHDWKRLNA